MLEFKKSRKLHSEILDHQNVCLNSKIIIKSLKQMSHFSCQNAHLLIEALPSFIVNLSVNSDSSVSPLDHVKHGYQQLKCQSYRLHE